MALVAPVGAVFCYCLLGNEHLSTENAGAGDMDASGHEYGFRSYEPMVAFSSLLLLLVAETRPGNFDLLPKHFYLIRATTWHQS
jgi:hypothetical protein